MTKAPDSIAGVFGGLAQDLSRSVARLDAASDELTRVFAAVALKVSASAGQLADAVAAAEIKAPKPRDVTEMLNRLDSEGADSLTRHERRYLIGAPGRLNAAQLMRLLDHAPSLARIAARTCLTYWPEYVREPWGATYEKILSEKPGSSYGSLLRVPNLTVTKLLARRTPGLETTIALQLKGETIQEAYEHLKLGNGVRDSWLLSSSALNAWLIDRLRREHNLDPAVLAILGHERLRTLLLPPRKNAANGPAVRTHVEAQAQTVATILAAGYANSRLVSHKTLAVLIEYLLKSTFDDPRLPLRSDGWNHVNRLYENGFRRLLAELCEQDLEVFFKHAMEEPDRHKFWLQYLSDIERTGCVLDRDLRKRLERKLQGRPELQGALERAYPFATRSDVQAFYLVFRSLVVVEFSKTGNAAYIYPREFFEKQLEPLIRRNAVGEVSELKNTRARVHRILHHAGGWQNDAAVWLASEGLHARQRERQR